MIEADSSEYNSSRSYSTGALMSDLWVLVKPYQWRFFAASVLRFSGDIMNLYPAYAVASIVSFFAAYKPGVSLERVWTLLLFLAFATAWRPVSRSLAKYNGYRVAERAGLDVQLKVLKHLFALDTSWHEKENAGNKMKRVQRGGEGANRILRMWIDRFIEIAVQFVGMTIVIAYFDRGVAAITVVFLATFFVVSFSFLKKASTAAHTVNVQEEHVSGLSFESINNIRTIKVLGIMRALFGLIEDATKDLFKKIKRRIFWFQLRGGALDLWGQWFWLGAVIVVIFGIIHGKYEVGFLVLFNGYFRRLWESVSELADSTQDYIVAKYGIARMQDILQEPLGIDVETGKVPFPKDWQLLRMEHVSFAYGDVDALEDVSFTIHRGERIGIVGLSGAGKSTLFKLLLKENEDYSGEIYFDEVPLRSISRSSYFEFTAAVLQETELFNFSLRDNITIAYFDANRDEQRVSEALEVSHVSDFLKKLPLGPDTMIGEKGIKLSGGERQRVGIARAVFKRPQLLFLDEATSHLDLESEEKIQDSLHTFFQSVTAVVIAHRLTTIKEMDKIFVIEDGRIIEEGDFDVLMQNRGRFFELWEKQKL